MRIQRKWEVNPGTDIWVIIDKERFPDVVTEEYGILKITVVNKNQLEITGISSIDRELEVTIDNMNNDPYFSSKEDALKYLGKQDKESAKDAAEQLREAQKALEGMSNIIMESLAKVLPENMKEYINKEDSTLNEEFFQKMFGKKNEKD